ncbi:MAG: V-type ATP synthase subunit I [Hespellia sp.]|nr:V-type ATP synthase subunit I [Hespellia sp.]
MAVLQMQKISICALKKQRKAVLEYLQSIGIMEMTQEMEEDAAFEKMDTVSLRVSFEKAAGTADQALEILQQYVPKKTSMLSSLAGKDLVGNGDLKKIISRREEIYRAATRIVKENKEIADHKANIIRIENSMEGLKPWLKLDVPMNYPGTKKTSILIGTMPGDLSMENLYGILAECAPDITGADIEIIYKDRDTTYLTILCLSEEETRVEEALRQNGFAKPSHIVTKVPLKKKESYEKQIEQLNKMIEEIKERIVAADTYREDIRLLSDYYRVRADKYEVLGTLPQTKNTFLVTGYVPKEAFQKARGILENRYGCVVDAEEISEEEEPPVLLQNNKFSESAEPILESYALPKKGEIDPTTVMSFFYVFFFGLMLSDAAYGAIISIACFVLLKKFPRMGPMRKSIRLFFWCGLSTLFWGIMFGGYFGDVINVVSKTFFGHEVGIRAAWFVPLNDPMRLLIYSMAFGTIHLLVGLGIKGYMEIKDKKYLDAVCDVGIWYVFLIGLLLLLIPSDIFASIAGAQIVFPPAVNLLAKIMAIGGALGLLLMSGRSSKNFGLRIALGAYDIYNVTGWLSDVLSYSRLLALGLATGVIASVVNQMGSMFGDGILGAVGFILVFIVGHTLNLAINLLGAYVHTNRLQYVEFFGKFYEGGGRAFHPFKANTKYVDFKEETNQ